MLTKDSADLAQKKLLSDVLGDVSSYVSKGEVATYIPALAKVPLNKLAIATADYRGIESSAGDFGEKFSIQSISKMFTLSFVLGSGLGRKVWQRVGREPSGDPFNSIMLLEGEKGIPRNPFINAGALVIADILCTATKGQDPVVPLLAMLTNLVGEPVYIDLDVADSEERSGYKNKALANFLKSYGNLENDVDEVLDLYFKQCSIAMNTTQLARAARFLAFDGVDPLTQNKIITAEDARRVNALMLMAGTYDAAGAFAFEIGIPCKSGVGGGIIGVVPDSTTVCVWSPGLDATGNSLAGRAALASFVARSGLSVF